MLTVFLYFLVFLLVSSMKLVLKWSFQFHETTYYFWLVMKRTVTQSTTYCLKISFVILLESVIESHADRLVLVGLKNLGTQYFRVSRI